MFNFSPFRKADRAIDDMPIRKADEPAKPKGNGQFKPGPQTKETRRGDNAFEVAKGHIDDAAEAAQGGDEELANYHLQMATQYAQLGIQNHLMSDYHGKAKVLGPARQPKEPAKTQKEGE